VPAAAVDRRGNPVTTPAAPAAVVAADDAGEIVDCNCACDVAATDVELTAMGTAAAAATADTAATPV